MGVQFNLSQNGSMQVGLYARVNQCQLTPPQTDASADSTVGAVVLIYANTAAYSAGFPPIIAGHSLPIPAPGVPAPVVVWPVADYTALRDQLDAPLLAIVEALPGYQVGTGIVVADPPPPPA